MRTGLKKSQKTTEISNTVTKLLRKYDYTNSFPELRYTSLTVKMGLGISRLIFTITGLVSYDLLQQRKWKRHSKSISKTNNRINKKRHNRNGYTVI